MFGNGNDTIIFQGQLGQLTITMVNDYDGSTVSIDDEFLINTGTYNGLGGQDTIFFSNTGDALFIEVEDEVTGDPVQTVISVEVFIAGNGGDVINLASSRFMLGDVRIEGGNGDDILWGNRGNDIINGGNGDDNINGGPGNDILDGGANNDLVVGGDGNDIIRGGTGDDVLDGAGGIDTITGGDGNDTLIGGAGSDNLTGGNGDDTYVMHGLIRREIDVINETSTDDINTIRYDSEITLADVTFAQVGTDVQIRHSTGGFIILKDQLRSDDHGIDNIIFSDGVEINLRNILDNRGPDAKDDIFESDENTVLNGNLLADNGNGADSDPDGDSLSTQVATITTAAGATVIIEANGDFTYTPLLDFVGVDNFTYTLFDGMGGMDLATAFVTVNDVPDDLVLNGDENDNVLIGGEGNDTIFGDLGSDLLDGGAGNDILHYSADEIWPRGFVAHNVGSPDAIINGDRIVVNPRYRNHDGFEGGDGIDTLQMGDDAEALFLDDRFSDNPFGFNTARIRDIEIIRAGDGNDIVDLTSKQFAYGDVSVYGDGGNDVLWTSSGNDFIDGGAGNDHLDGGTGNDILKGGSGVDKLYGRGGDDIFVFEGETAFDAFDYIKDWNDGDKLDISDILSDVGFDPVSDAISDFVNIRSAGSHSFVQIDQDGAGTDHVFQDIVRIDNQALDLATLIADDAIVV